MMTWSALFQNLADINNVQNGANYAYIYLILLNYFALLLN